MNGPQPPSEPDAIDAALDAYAFLSALMRGDRDGALAIFHANDDAKHWRDIAETLCGVIAGTADRLDLDLDGMIGWRRTQILSGNLRGEG